MKKYIKLHGARKEIGDEGDFYNFRGFLYVNPSRIDAYYDHGIVMSGIVLTVEETCGEIAQLIGVDADGNDKNY